MARGTAKTSGKSRLHESGTDISKVQPRRITSDVRVIFGKNLNKLMLERGVSASDLARHCFGTTEEKGFEVANGRDRISKYLHGKSFPEYATLPKIADKLDCSLDDLLPPEVLTALQGTASPIITVELSPTTGFHKVKMNGEFSQKFVEELVILVAKHRGTNNVRDNRRRKRA